MHIDVNDNTESLTPEHIHLIKQLLMHAASSEKVSPNAEVSISFVTNDEIQMLNRDYRTIDRPTDVISFALEEDGEEGLKIIGDDKDLPIMLGDIIISVEQAKEQAKEYNHSLERELGFLAVHGFLHLLGYDHMNEADEKKMFQRQKEILGEFHLER